MEDAAHIAVDGNDRAEKYAKGAPRKRENSMVVTYCMAGIKIILFTLFISSLSLLLLLLFPHNTACVFEFHKSINTYNLICIIFQIQKVAVMRLKAICQQIKEEEKRQHMVINNKPEEEETN